MTELLPGRARRRRPHHEGWLEVFVTDEQDAEPVDVTRWSRLATDVLTDRGVRGEAELSVLFVDEVAMAELNAHFMDAEGPTDVLAFPIDDDVVELSRVPDSTASGPDRRSPSPDEAPVLLGDVVICPAVAGRNAPAHARLGHDGGLVDELALLVVHGVLHVLGMDHADPADAAAMRAAEDDLLARYHREKP